MLPEVIDTEKNIKVSIKINNIKNLKEVQEILFLNGYYWYDIKQRFKNLALENLYINLKHYDKKPKELTFSKFCPKSYNYINITDYKLIRNYKLQKINKENEK